MINLARVIFDHWAKGSKEDLLNVAGSYHSAGSLAIIVRDVKYSGINKNKVCFFNS